MRYSAVAWRLPGWLRRHILHFEWSIEEAVSAFANTTKQGCLVLDAGAGEARHAAAFPHARYVGVDLAVGDPAWNYRRLDAIANLDALPFADRAFSRCLNIVTLEHVRDPQAVMDEIARVLAPSGRLLLIAPQEWEVHQAPNDYFRYTRHGLELLLGRAGLQPVALTPVGGFFRLLARRMLNALQFFAGGIRWLGFLPAAFFLVPPALILPWLDFLDRQRNFTLGYICVAMKPE
ncbi:MAG: class I SAM-dependent methyltransferase [Bryobacterales bacterium]|nr:class I SAM-dependent methyltransferase [Bryobacterales bacterium]